MRKTEIRETVWIFRVAEKSPKLILIDSYGIGQHGQHHIERDKMCEDVGCLLKFMPF